MPPAGRGTGGSGGGGRPTGGGFRPTPHNARPGAATTGGKSAGFWKFIGWIVAGVLAAAALFGVGSAAIIEEDRENGRDDVNKGLDDAYGPTDEQRTGQDFAVPGATDVSLPPEAQAEVVKVDWAETQKILDLDLAELTAFAEYKRGIDPDLRQAFLEYGDFRETAYARLADLVPDTSGSGLQYGDAVPEGVAAPVDRANMSSSLDGPAAVELLREILQANAEATADNARAVTDVNAADPVAAKRAQLFKEHEREAYAEAGARLAAAELELQWLDAVDSSAVEAPSFADVAPASYAGHMTADGLTTRASAAAQTVTAPGGASTASLATTQQWRPDGSGSVTFTTTRSA